MVVVVIVAVVVFIIVSNQNSGGADIGKPASPAVVNQVTNVNPSVIAAVGTGKLPTGKPITNPLRAISGPALPVVGGKPEFLYIGGEFCPYCAALRWSMVNALSRFGTFSNLHYMRSAASDLNLATLTFHGSSYTSKYINFVGIENEDRNHNQLEPLNAQQQQLLSSLGDNGYPFVDIAGKYANDAPNSYPGGYDQSVLSGMDWSQIAGALTNSNSSITQGVIGVANYLTAGICSVTNNKPASACNTATIKNIEQQAPYKH